MSELERAYAGFHRVLGEFYRELNSSEPQPIKLRRGAVTLYPEDGLQRLWGVDVLRWAHGEAAVAPLGWEARHVLFLGEEQAQGENRYNTPIYLFDEADAVGLDDLLATLEEFREKAVTHGASPNARGLKDPVVFTDGDLRLHAQVNKRTVRLAKDDFLRDLYGRLKREQHAAASFERVNPHDEETLRVYAKVREVERAINVLETAPAETFVKVLLQPRLMVAEGSGETYSETFVRQTGLLVTGEAKLEVTPPNRATRDDKVTREVLAPLLEVGAVLGYEEAAWDAAVTKVKESGRRGA